MAEKYNMQINKKVRELRKKKGYTQERLAELLGMKTSTYSQMERSGKIPLHIILKLTEIFEVNLDEIMLPEKEGLVIETPQVGTGPLKQRSIDIDVGNFFPEELVLSNREENNIIMLRNLNTPDREKVYALIKELHDKKFKKG